ncbi:hypothetical protein A3759_30240 [Thalassolituus sp. HI0120]|nr:hypothetical protein A3759_08345 [Thalassolituus sp. HI0120]KZZ47343.1 hypothetical protein A3759_30240 [Thalassolituus sp. HI0120]
MEHIGPGNKRDKSSTNIPCNGRVIAAPERFFIMMLCAAKLRLGRFMLWQLTLRKGLLRVKG